MLVCDPKRASSNVDRMALDHLKAAGVIFAKDRTKRHTKNPKGKIGWKRLNPTGWDKGRCDQCGKAAGIVTPGNPYHMALCPKCESVHKQAIKCGMKRNEDVNW